MKIVRPVATSENYLIFAAVFWVAVSFAGPALASAGVYGAKSLVELSAFIALTIAFPEEPRRSTSPGMIFGSVGIAMLFVAGWVAFYALPFADDFQFPDPRKIDRLDLIAGYVASGLIAPLFEEKICRHLGLRGTVGVITPAVAKFAPPAWIASVIISLIFSLAHPTLMILTFAFSLILCGLALKYSFSTAHRALIHGLYNCGVMTFYMSHGFGFWA